MGSALLILVGSPIFLLLALAIKIDSKGAVLFRQERVGQDGKLFRMYKFRTMHADAPSYEYSPRASSDPGSPAWENSCAAPVWMKFPSF